MPFTISHPAIVLPLALLPKRYVSLTGLVIGSMAPDFEYFIRFQLQSDYSHSILGTFYFNLPLAIILAYIFHNISRNSLIRNLPIFLKSRFVSCIDFDWNSYFVRNWIAVVTSIIIGSFSHIFWDSFTHYGGYFVEHYSILKSEIEVLSWEFPILKVLQHASTVVGIIFIGAIIFRIKPENNLKAEPNRYYWLLIVSTLIIILSLRFIIGLELTAYGNIIVTNISAFILGLIFTPLILSIVNRKRNFKI